MFLKKENEHRFAENKFSEWTHRLIFCEIIELMEYIMQKLENCLLFVFFIAAFTLARR